MARTMKALLVSFGLTALAAEVPSWQVDYERSRVSFVAKQTGAEFEGGFDEFTAEIRFDPAALAESSASVVIDTASVNTQNDERDGYLRGAGWFETDTYPETRFEAGPFEALGDDRYRTVGRLTVRDNTVEVPFEFTIEANGSEVHLTGSAELERLALDLGTGDWADTSLIGGTVEVRVEIVAER